MKMKKISFMICFMFFFSYCKDNSLQLRKGQIKKALLEIAKNENLKFNINPNANKIEFSPCGIQCIEIRRLGFTEDDLRHFNKQNQGIDEVEMDWSFIENSPNKKNEVLYSRIYSTEDLKSFVFFTTYRRDINTYATVREYVFDEKMDRYKREETKPF